ncbi:glycosyltransferase family 2 protein [Bacillus methanolicus]|uniref:Putative glycosyltransferase n=1 Tax=Bacillus methanolicus (strain MGA3 / ATCC 53907) TaxID=796606 RepID=I3E378_BACMM|nr:glycosyltransferase family 2 protein [Bacillus methanolicus]AIE58959.1 putative glycosyltransferase [Bacillus methanolicus MGA3]EIJ80949.1 bactoprenol glucosyl transferase [Bacillus methanolicus MGA3]UQD51027.1 glycosyltransferase [Bacillus methanolicus]
MNKPVLTIVVPCYNEQEVLIETASQLSGVLNELISDFLISKESKILFVDDGSKDRTWELIEKESEKNPFVKGIKLARNVGHQNALIAGLETASKQSDCVISIDADLQDDINVIRTFVEKYWEGFDIVYGVRDSRETDTFFKRTTALGFYRFMEKIGIKLVPNHADFRLMSKRALDELLKYKETNLFLRGLVPLLGFPSTKVYYDRKERFAGESKYPLKKMLAFAFDGITSFSVAPIRFVTFLGFLSVIFSAIAGGYALIQEILGHTESGWTSLMVSIWFVGGLQLMGIGIIGEYIGKIYSEVKRRPRYAIEMDIFSSNESGNHQKEAVLNKGR